jgi:hypothetical protein
LLAESFPQAASRHLQDAKILLDKQRWDNAVYLAGYVVELLVHAMSPSVRETARYSEYDEFKLKAYQVFTENYYYENNEVPNLGDDEAPFTPVKLPLQDGLQGDISLFIRDENDGEIIRLQDLINLMTNEDYQTIAKRLCLRLNKRLNKIEEEII